MPNLKHFPIRTISVAVVLAAIAATPAHAQRQEAQPISRADIEAAVDCASLAAGVECSCVIDQAFAAAPGIPPVTVVNESRRADHRAMNARIIHQVRVSQAINAGKAACSPPDQPPAETDAQP